jgi:RecG-like helicase
MLQPAKLYVDYLSTDELASCINRTREKISTARQQGNEQHAELLQNVLEDLTFALVARQLSILDEITEERADKP